MNSKQEAGASITTIAEFGCQGSWAYLWADITGAGSKETIGVTEVLEWMERPQQWAPVDRAIYCHPGKLPSLVYRKGCFSN